DRAGGHRRSCRAQFSRPQLSVGPRAPQIFRDPAEQRASGRRAPGKLGAHPPLTQQRVQYIRDHVQQARCSNTPDSPDSVELLRRIKAKLHAFLDDPSKTLSTYPTSDRSPIARYARAIAYYRMPKLDLALPEIDGLIRDF